MTIKIRYIFVDRKSVNLEFADEDRIAAFIIEDRRREANLNRKERRHNYSLNAIAYEGEEYFDKDTPEELFLEKEIELELLVKIHDLTETQRRRLAMRLHGMSINEIATAENVSQQRISATLKQIRKKIF